jgi:hypothetical protein
MKLLVLVVSVIACAAPMAALDGPLHPKVPGYTLRDGVIYGPAGPEYKLVVRTAVAGVSSYEVQTLDGAMLVTISCSKEARTRSSQDPRIEVECTVQFVTIDRGFTAGFPDRPITNLIGVWIKMGALAGGQAQLAGLEQFAAKTGITIESIKAYDAEMAAAMRDHDCNACAASYRACQVDSTHPGPGLTVTQSCEARYEACAQRIGTCSAISR